VNGGRNRIIVGDARRVVGSLPRASVDCIISSPPYFALRNYRTTNQIGLEATVDGWVGELRVVLRGLARVLKPTGSLWLNLGDSYSRQLRVGAPPKSLLLGPERLALAMIEDGWIIRNKILWAKTNPMPISVRDRLSCTHEVLYFATRSPRYFFDLDAIRVPHRSTLKRPSVAAAARASLSKRPDWAGPLAGSNNGLDRTKAEGRVGHPLGKNPGDVWTFATSNVANAQHALFPEALITRPLIATCPERVCARCSAPWQRDGIDRERHNPVPGELRASCDCQSGTRPGLVFDPFIGAGTTALVAERHGRDWLGLEINPNFAAAAMRRIEAERQTRTKAATRERPMAA
jgi:site-specific DNA-methyltransferase (adenine-specific)